jgi:hypothetical protein
LSLLPHIWNSIPSPSSDPAIILPLCKVKRGAGVESFIHIHVPFSLFGLSKIEKHLSSFVSDPTTHRKEFLYITHFYYLIWHDMYVILSSTVPSEDRDHIWAAAQKAYVDTLHQQDAACNPSAVPRDDSNWDYQAGSQDLRPRGHTITCLLAGVNKSALKEDNYEKIK